MFKRSIILLCFLAYSLTLVHSIVPHHHHDESISNAYYGSHHHDHFSQDENKTVGHAFADAIHLPGSDIALHGQSQDNVQRQFDVTATCVDHMTHRLVLQSPSPDFNYDYRPTRYSTATDSLFLLRAPPVA